MTLADTLLLNAALITVIMVLLWLVSLPTIWMAIESRAILAAFLVQLAGCVVWRVSRN